MQNMIEFKIDKWVEQHEPRAQIGLHDSFVSALSLNDLQRLHPNGNSPVDPDLKLTYGATLGSECLRERIAELHSSPEVSLSKDNVVITPGSIMANYLVLNTICGASDHIICQYPTYGQLYLLPRFNGVNISFWTMRETSEWSLDMEDLARMIQTNTKAIIINTPNNPTGAVLSKSSLDQILATARKHNITVFSDEVFRPLFHSNEPQPPALVSLPYSRTVSTGSVSKAYCLPGIRLGWVVSPDKDILQRIITLRDYTTLSVSQLDDQVAAFALSKEVLPRLMERNLEFCARSIACLDDFVKRNSPRCRWAKPKGSGIAFIQFLNKDKSPVDDLILCERLVNEAGIAVIPGSYCFAEQGADDLKGYVRVGLGSPEKLSEGLLVLEEFLHKYYNDN